MTENYCDVCYKTYEGSMETIELSEENGKNKIYINGHTGCIDTLYAKIKNVKDYNKKSVEKLLKEVNFKMEN